MKGSVITVTSILFNYIIIFFHGRCNYLLLGGLEGEKIVDYTKPINILRAIHLIFFTYLLWLDDWSIKYVVLIFNM